MGHPVDLKREDLRKLVASLVHRSETLEIHPHSDQQAAMDSLQEFDSLSHMTNQALTELSAAAERKEIDDASKAAEEKSARKRAASTTGLPQKITASRVRAAVNGRPTAATTTPNELARALQRISGAASAAAASLQRPAVEISSPVEVAPLAPPPRTGSVLDDRSVVDALLEFHAKNSPARPARTEPRAPVSTNTRTGARNPTALPQFRPAEIPIVGDFETKEPPRFSQRSGPPTTGVFRGKRDSGG